MGRRRAARPDLALNGEPAVHAPIMEKSVHKRVPAVVHWDTVEGTDRTDKETIGESIIYDDGTTDILIFDNISADAKRLVGIINQSLEGYSIKEG